MIVKIALMLAVLMPVGSQHARTARQVECDREAMGAVYRSQGHAARVVWTLRADMVGDEPKDAIHIRDDGETSEQKAAWESSLLHGWQQQDDYMTAHGGQAREPYEVLMECVSSSRS